MLTVQVSLLFEILIDVLFFLKETSDETMDCGTLGWLFSSFRTLLKLKLKKKSHKYLLNFCLRNQMVLTCSLSKRCSKFCQL